MANFCFNKHQNLWSYFQSKKSLKSMTDAFLGHPVQQFLRNPEFFNFNFNGFRLPWPSRLQKYVSMCLPNSNVIILLLPCCDTSVNVIKSLRSYDKTLMIQVYPCLFEHIDALQFVLHSKLCPSMQFQSILMKHKKNRNLLDNPLIEVKTSALFSNTKKVQFKSMFFKLPIL